jgi:hypothetical protein
MADEIEATQDSAEEPHGTETDWKAMARKWESQAKANKAAADELEALKAERMTEAERLTARAEKAEAELAALQAQRQLAADAAEVAKATGAPEKLLAYCASREAMEAMAEDWKASQPEQPAARAPKAERSRIVRDGEAKPSAAMDFAEYMQEVMNQRSQ